VEKLPVNVKKKNLVEKKTQKKKNVVKFQNKKKNN